MKKGLFCKFCPLFVTTSVGGYRKNVLLNKLVLNPLISFTKLLGKEGALIKQAKCDYHVSAVGSGINFLKIENPKKML